MATESMAELSLKDEDSTDEMQETAFAKRGCCFWIPCIGAERSPTVGAVWWERIRTREMEESWWSKGWSTLKNVKLCSEVVAGPRWKNFIRRLSNNRTGGGRHGKFHYDPLGYALNFDEGPGQNGNLDEDYVFRDFSVRYASIPASAKSSMDLGKDAPSFI